MKLIYWSSTGNTEEMANLILSGIKEAGKDATLINVSSDTISSIAEDEVLALGCSACGAEELDEGEFVPAIDALDLTGKKVAIFGSYGWGGGEYAGIFKEKVEELGGTVILEPLLVEEHPEGETAEECVEFGRQLAAL